MSENRVTTADLSSGCRQATASPNLVQWDRGQILKLTGVTLPLAYNVEFTTPSSAESVTMLGNADGVEIPDALLETGEPIVAYVVLHDTVNDRESEYWVTIVVRTRQRPEDIDPDADQMALIDQLVAALDEGVDQAEAAAAQAEAAVEKYPRVINGNWYVWDEATEEWIDTEVPATGPTGVGIASITQNADYTLTITFTDGNDWTTPTSVRGVQGETGATPNLSIGTVTTLAAGSPATASISGTPENPLLSLGIPKGADGDVSSASMASTFSSSTAYTKGTMVWYSGQLYEFTADHAAGAWTGSDARAVKVGEEVSTLKSALNDTTYDLYGVASATFTAPKAVIYNTGEVYTVSTIPTLNASDYAEIKTGSTKLTCPMCNALNTTNRGLAFYDSTKTYISGVRENYNTVAASYDIRTVDVPSNAKYVRFSYYTDDSPVPHPPFFAYTDLSTDEQISDIRSKLIGTAEVTPANLFNPDDPDVLLNKEISSNGTISDSNAYAVSGFIPCVEGEYYTFPVYSGHFGGNAKYIACYTAEKAFADASTGTVTDGINVLKIKQYKNIKYFRVCVCMQDANSNQIITPYHSWSNFMIVHGSELPSRFIPYSGQKLADASVYSAHENLSNPLYGKKTVFLGDSICEGDAEGGWAKRIGVDNTMLWENAGIGGSTIAITAAGKTICTRSITMSDPDYIILEGGTNDADRIGDATGETKPAAFGTWAEDNYGTNDISTYYGFDIETFCGAVDYMCKRFVSIYPAAKIGFIGAQKMGTVDATRKNRGYYIHTAMEICRKWGISCLNLWDECHMNPTIPSHYTSGEDYLYIDGQHPTANGYNYMTPIISAWMKTL